MNYFVILLFFLHANTALSDQSDANGLNEGGRRRTFRNVTDNPCPIAFHHIGGRCYFYGYFKLNWFRAAEFCHSFGQSVSLACIESPEENQHLKEWLTKHGDHSTGVWVGGSDNGHTGKWAWFPTGQLIRSFNWGPSQPSGGDQHCMYIVGGFLGYQWADFHCEFQMTFLCEYQVNSQLAWRKRKKKLLQRARNNDELEFFDGNDNDSSTTVESYMSLLRKKIYDFTHLEINNTKQFENLIMDDSIGAADHYTQQLNGKINPSTNITDFFPKSRAEQRVPVLPSRKKTALTTSKHHRQNTANVMMVHGNSVLISSPAPTSGSFQHKEADTDYRIRRVKSSDNPVSETSSHMNIFRLILNRMKDSRQLT